MLSAEAGDLIMATDDTLIAALRRLSHKMSGDERFKPDTVVIEHAVQALEECGQGERPAPRPFDAGGE